MTHPRRVDVHFCSSIPLIDYLSIATSNAKVFAGPPAWLIGADVLVGKDHHRNLTTAPILNRGYHP